MTKRKALSDQLAEKEFILIQEIAKKETHTQRSLSESIGLSLGTTNLLIQRLARKGYIKINQLDWKRTQYLLTLKGAMEKTQKVFDYTRYTLRLFKQIQANIATVVQAEYDKGRRDFVIVAQDELLELIKETITPEDFPAASFSFLTDFAQVGQDNDFVLTATKEVPPPHNGRRYTSLVDFHNVNFRLS